LGFIWDPQAADWEKGFKALEAYKEEHGNCRVPFGYPPPPSKGFKLGRWVVTQRTNKDSMDPERKKQLDALGFDWEKTPAESWEEGFKALVAYKKEFKDCDVRRGHKTSEGYLLGNWVSNQRRFKDSMDPERKERLDALGFIWKAKRRRKTTRPVI
jgi:hypothetical protein